MKIQVQNNLTEKINNLYECDPELLLKILIAKDNGEKVCYHKYGRYGESIIAYEYISYIRASVSNAFNSRAYIQLFDNSERLIKDYGKTWAFTKEELQSTLH